MSGIPTVQTRPRDASRRAVGAKPFREAPLQGCVLRHSLPATAATKGTSQCCYHKRCNAMKSFKHLIAKLLQAKPHETVVIKITCLHKQQDYDKMLPLHSALHNFFPFSCPLHHQILNPTCTPVSELQHRRYTQHWTYRNFDSVNS